MRQRRGVAQEQPCPRRRRGSGGVELAFATLDHLPSGGTQTRRHIRGPGGRPHTRHGHHSLDVAEVLALVRDPGALEQLRLGSRHQADRHPRVLVGAGRRRRWGGALGGDAFMPLDVHPLIGPWIDRKTRACNLATGRRAANGQRERLGAQAGHEALRVRRVDSPCPVIGGCKGRPLQVERMDQLGDAAAAAGDEGDAESERLQHRVGRVVHRRGHDREPARLADVRPPPPAGCDPTPPGTATASAGRARVRSRRRGPPGSGSHCP